MIHPQSSWPLEGPEQLTEALREQGATPEEIADLLPALSRLSEVQAPAASTTDTQRLLARLTPQLPTLSSVPQLPTLSPVRQAIREHRQHQGTGISWLLAIARTQVSLFGVAFWLVSTLVTLVGTVVVLSNNQSQQELVVQELVLRASGPLLAYLGTIIAFRGTREHVLECELVCPPSPLQLTIARLVIVLGYDVGLGLALSLALWAGGVAQVLALTLSWFMPLLLVAGLALLLSLRLSVQTAASVAYGSWLAILAIHSTSSLQVLPLTPLSDALLGAIGLALLTIALLRLHTDLHRLLPRL